MSTVEPKPSGYRFRMEGSAAVLTKGGVDVCWVCDRPLGATFVTRKVARGLATMRQCGREECLGQLAGDDEGPEASPHQTSGTKV